MDAERAERLIAVLTMIECRLGEIASAIGGSGMPDSSQAQNDRYLAAAALVNRGAGVG